MSKRFSYLVLTMLFTFGLAVGGTLGSAPVVAQNSCEEDECDSLVVWYKPWTWDNGDGCVVNAGAQTFCDALGPKKCKTRSCNPGSEDPVDDDE